MPKWTSLPREALLYNPYQQAFWQARRKRVCTNCKHEYECPPDLVCPLCSAPRGLRSFNHLTVIAGRRGGKTLAGGIAALEEASIPNTIGWACAPTNPKLHRYVIPVFQQLIPADWVASWNSEYGDLRLKNGSLIHFQTLEDPDQGRGQGLDWLWIDEVCELTEMHWLVASPSLTERKGVAFFTTSPRSYDWVYEKLYKPAVENVPGFWAAKYRTCDNPLISERELDQKRATMPDAMFRQEFEADFVVFTGAIYSDSLNDAVHILHDKEAVQKILPEWPNIGAHRAVLMGLDAGADHPFGGVKLVSTEKGLVVVGEYLERHRPVIQHAAALRALANSPNVRWAINKNDPQMIMELAQHGIFCQKAENDVVAGTERVKTWLHHNQLFFVADLCPQTIKQLKSYRWADNVARDGQTRQEKVYKKDDELPDCLRYALMTWPLLPTVAKKSEGRDPSTIPEQARWAWERNRRIEAREKDPEPLITGDFWS